MEIKDKVLETMKAAGEPLNAGKIAERYTNSELREVLHVLKLKADF